MAKEVYSFHIIKIGFWQVLKHLLIPLYRHEISGLMHSEAFLIMNLGMPVLSLKRYNLNSIALFLRWESLESYQSFFTKNLYQVQTGRHLQMKAYRQWGELTDLKNSVLHNELINPREEVAAVTVARLKIAEIARFVKWGKPVEAQVRDHAGKIFSIAAFRPPNNFCTFSIWKSEIEMVGMVQSFEHKTAMEERLKKDFHYEFTTMRFTKLFGDFFTSL